MMILPPGLRALRGQRPLLADYILGAMIIIWGCHVILTPAHDVSEMPSYNWILPQFVLFVGAASVAIGFLQCLSAAFLWTWARCASCVLSAALFLEIAYKIHLTEPSAPGWSVDLGLAVGNLVLFLWVVP